MKESSTENYYTLSLRFFISFLFAPSSHCERSSQKNFVERSVAIFVSNSQTYPRL